MINMQAFCVVPDNDKQGPALLEVSHGSGVVYVEGRWSKPEEDDGAPIFLVYSRKQALRVALALIYCVVRSFRRFR